MNRIDGETISALVDGEIEPDAHRAAVTRLLEDGPEALGTFGRYRLIGDVMRDESVIETPVAARVRAALQDEPTVLAPVARRQPRWLRPIAGAAVAASVAAAAVFVAPQLMTEGESPVATQPAIAQLAPAAIAPQLVSEPARADGPERPNVVTAATRWQALDAGLEQRLNRLVIEHHEYAGRTGVHGPVPHIGLVSYDAR